MYDYKTPTSPKLTTKAFNSRSIDDRGGTNMLTTLNAQYNSDIKDQEYSDGLQDHRGSLSFHTALSHLPMSQSKEKVTTAPSIRGLSDGKHSVSPNRRTSL